MTERTLQEEIAKNYETYIAGPERRQKIQNLLQELKQNPSWINGIPEPDVTGLNLHDELQARFDRQEKQNLLDDLKQSSPNIFTSSVNVENNLVDDYRNTMKDIYSFINQRMNPVANYNSLKEAAKEFRKLSPVVLNDKYKHAVVSCVGAQGGVPSAIATLTGGALKELGDIGYKSFYQATGTKNYGGYNQILTDSWNDWSADVTGVQQGYDKPHENCRNLMSGYYNPYLKR